MKLQLNNIPRQFSVGKNQTVTISDVGSLQLEIDEQVSFLTEDNQEYDVCRKSWGFYATPSLNDRLKRFGFKTALVKNNQGNRFVLLVEEKKINLFHQYILEEQLSIMQWLDEEPVNSQEICPICHMKIIVPIKNYREKPIGENDFQFIPYYRDLLQCKTCLHCFNVHSYDLSTLYQGHYAETLYQHNLKNRFEKIMHLPSHLSDNFYRVQRIAQFFQKNKTFHVLDIGSGLGVFPAKLKEMTEWNCIALDPDLTQVQHLQKNCGLEVIHADVMHYEGVQSFDLVTLNKVLEHIPNPLLFLEKIKHSFLSKPGSYLYIEVPDGEIALQDSPDREEFFIEHFHAFSFHSLQVLLKKLAFNILNVSRIREPSGKYTLYCFLQT